MTKKVKLWWNRFKAKTPKKFRVIRNTAVTIAGALTAGITAVQAISIDLPETYIKYSGILIFICTVIATIAQSFQEKGGKNG